MAVVIIGAIIMSIVTGYMIYLINEPKTALDCRMKFGKGTTEMFECLEKIKEKIATQSPSKIGPLNLYHQHCAQLFDSNLEAWSPPGPNYNPPTLAHIILGSTEFQEFRASDCRLSIFDWAYLSENQEFIWNSNMQWPEFTQWPESEIVYGVCGPNGAIQEDGYCYKDGKRIEFKNTEFDPENKKCFNNYGNGTRIEISCEDIPFSQGVKSFDSYKQEFERDNPNFVSIQPQIGKTGKYLLELDDGSVVDINYSITGASIESMQENKESESIIIDLETIHDGSLKISIPRFIADAKAVNGIDDIPFFILINGEEVVHDELSSTIDTRTIIIDFKKDTTQIEIVGADHV